MVDFPKATSRDMTFTGLASAPAGVQSVVGGAPGPVGIRPAAAASAKPLTDAQRKEAQRMLEDAIDTIIRPAITLSQVDASLFGVQIFGGVHPRLVPRLREVEQALGFPTTKGVHGITDISGYQGPHHGRHSLGVAFDINGMMNPYIIYEAGEQRRDAGLVQVYERIAQFMVGHTSAIPGSIRGSVSTGTRRDELYRKLREESDAMRRYFAMMQDQVSLRDYLESGVGAVNYSRVAWPFDRASFDAPRPLARINLEALDRITHAMQEDWVALAGRAGPPIAPAGSGLFSPGPSTGGTSGSGAAAPRQFDYPIAAALPGDPPFKGRDPRKGFLDLELSLVQALTDHGFVWGAIAFGSESGDLMHFHDEDLAKKLELEARVALGLI